MAKAIIMPKQGLQMTEGLISTWLAQEGDVIEEGKPLFEMETDKLTITIDASASGILLKIVHPAGDTVPITETIAIVGEVDEDYSSLLTNAAPTAQPEAAIPVCKAAPLPGELDTKTVFASPRARMRADETRRSLCDITGSGPDGLIIERDVLAAGTAAATPLARKLAALNGINLDGITGTGARGKVVADDVKGAAAATAITQVPAATRTKMSNIRRSIALHMHQSLSEQAQANHRMSVDMTEAIRIREQIQQSGQKLSLNTIILYCVARALKKCPEINAALDGDDIVQYTDVHLGMAVATERGLLVPVIRNADTKTLSEMSAESARLANGVKIGTASPDCLHGGTFTVTNLGMYDVDSFTAIINAPEAAILAVGKVQKQPVVLNDAIAIRPIMQLSLTYDHRIVDGAPAALFLRTVRDLLQSPALLLY